MADFKAIETFMWVVTLGSFRGAAHKLNTTQPAISQRIAQLEREVGVKLLQRDRRMVLPTPSGRQLMVYAEKLIGLRSEMLAVVGARSAMRGVLRLGVAETIVHTWLSQLIKSVNQAYPNLSLEIEVDITSNLRTRLMAQEIELAFLLGPLTAPTCPSRIRMIAVDWGIKELRRRRIRNKCPTERGYGRSIRLGDALRFVVNLQRDLPQLVGMLLAVVRAEEQLESAGHDDAYIRLGAATVAAIGSVEGGALDDWSAHSWPRFRDRVDLVSSESGIRDPDTGLTCTQHPCWL